MYNSPADEAERISKFSSGGIPVAVYGLGKMGLPLAAVYAETCQNVIGVDVDPAVVAAVENGDCPVKGEPGLPELVEETVSDGSLRATTDIEAGSTEAQIHVAIVPTLLNESKHPDLSIIESLLDEIAPQLDPGDTVFIESTVPPGACNEQLLPRLEGGSGLERGQFGLAFCPERTSSGRAIEDIRGAYPKIVGGIDDESTTVAQLVYEQLNASGVIPVSNATTAEAVKITEGIYRDVNIALANELASLSDHLPIDFNEVADAANTIPFINVHRPGAGVGGHCIPYYPYFLINWLDAGFPLLQTSRNVNDSMPHFTVDTLIEQLDAVGQSIADSNVLVLGVTYRAGVEETRATPAKPIIDRLLESAKNVYVTDPMIDDLSDFGGCPLSLEEIYNIDLDAVILVTAHEEFKTIDWSSFDPMVVVNGRKSMPIETENHRVYTIGSGIKSIGEL